LPDHEANLVLESMGKSYPEGAVVVVLIGHNQAINQGEKGINAWFRAAKDKKWHYAINDMTLDLPGIFQDPSDKDDAATSGRREQLIHGHLSASMRHYRNESIEKWVSAVLEGSAAEAETIASSFTGDDEILVVRDLEKAKEWIRGKRIGDLRAGILASSTAKRLSAAGVDVAKKSEDVIVNWMLAPSGDFRSSNMLEKAVTQFDIQGLEIDYSLVCWGADLRREGDEWVSFKMVAPNWSRIKDTENFTKKELESFRKNTYRVLLTRARKGMIIFVPIGDETGQDLTCKPEFYDSIFEHLISCGAKKLP